MDVVLKDWMEATCCEYGWSCGLQSPLVWRELVQRGHGKRSMLIGGANEFREYASAYYDVRSSLGSPHLLQVHLIYHFTGESLEGAHMPP